MKEALKKCGIGLVLIAVMSALSCNDEHHFSTSTSHRLSFSADTVAFDTLFTGVSSATNTFLIYNRNKASLRIAHAALSGGAASPYRVNIDGLSGTSFSDIAIRGGDSMYVFVEVTVDPRGQDAPFEVRDSLQLVLESGVRQQILFTASGQDATVLRGTVISADTWLTASRPYLVYDSLRVEAGSTLYMAPGTRLYFADGVELQVHGRIEAVGRADSLVLFRGARTDRMFDYLPYDRLTAQWGGITLHPTSSGNIFEHCDIHSGTYGIRAENEAPDPLQPKLTMHSTQIHNVEEDALQLTACVASFYNSLFSNAGGHCVNILGGRLDFTHCTMANFYPWKSGRGAAVNIANCVEEEEGRLYPLYRADFTNCIVTGSGNDELSDAVVAETDTADWSEYAQYTFSHSVINSWSNAREPDSLHFVHIVWEHKDSVAYGGSNFRTIDHSNFVYDFHLDSLSVARGKGLYVGDTVDGCDKDGVPRNPEGPVDVGCYQYVAYAREEAE